MGLWPPLSKAAVLDQSHVHLRKSGYGEAHTTNLTDGSSDEEGKDADGYMS